MLVKPVGSPPDLPNPPARALLRPLCLPLPPVPPSPVPPQMSAPIARAAPRAAVPPPAVPAPRPGPSGPVVVLAAPSPAPLPVGGAGVDPSAPPATVVPPGVEGEDGDWRDGITRPPKDTRIQTEVGDSGPRPFFWRVPGVVPVPPRRVGCTRSHSRRCCARAGAACPASPPLRP